LNGKWGCLLSLIVVYNLPLLKLHKKFIHGDKKLASEDLALILKDLYTAPDNHTPTLLYTICVTLSMLKMLKVTQIVYKRIET